MPQTMPRTTGDVADYATGCAADCAVDCTKLVQRHHCNRSDLILVVVTNTCCKQLFARLRLKPAEKLQLRFRLSRPWPSRLSVSRTNCAWASVRSAFLQLAARPGQCNWCCRGLGLSSLETNKPAHISVDVPKLPHCACRGVLPHHRLP